MLNNKYDPRMKKIEELAQTFANGERILENLLKDLQPRESKAPTRQSWIITGARGAGKSHLLALLYHRIRSDKTLSAQWIPILFPEELFGADSLYRLLLIVFQHIFKKEVGSRISGHILKEIKKDLLEIKKIRITGNLKQKKDSRRQLAKQLFQLLLKLKTEANKPFILMLENLQYLLRDQLPADDVKLLRGFMHEHPDTFIIIGTALTVFGEIEDYGKPFFHFFRIRVMESLDQAGIIGFLKKLAAFRNDPGIEQKIRNNRHYIHVYSLLTGGNPRLVLFLYELLLNNEILDTEMILGKITELTPYFLDKTRDESGQRKLILDALATEAPAQTAREVAEYINEDQRSISEQFKRLAKEGWIREIAVAAENTKRNEVFYVLRDYFYRIWYKVRSKGIEESDIHCMTELAVLLFGRQEIRKRIQQHTQSERESRLLYEKSLELVENDQFMKNIKILIEESKQNEDNKIQDIRNEILTLNDMKEWQKLIHIAEKLLDYPTYQHLGYFCFGHGHYWAGDYKRSLKCYKRVVEIKPDAYQAWINMGSCHSYLKEYEKAIECYEKAVEIKPDTFPAWFNLGINYYSYQKYEKAYNAFSRSIFHIPGFETIDFSTIDELKIISKEIFYPSQELGRLLDVENSREIKFESVCRLLLLGKFTAVTDELDELLDVDQLPENETKKLEFFLKAVILDILKNKAREPELKLLLKYWILLISRIEDPLSVRRKFLRFVNHYVEVVGKENVSLPVVEDIIDQLYGEGIETSDMILRIIRAVQNPDTREARQWMPDPLFATIVKELSERDEWMNG